MAGVIVAADDLLLGTRIQEAARHLNVPVTLVRTRAELMACSRATRPALLIVDLHCQACEPLAAIRGVKADSELKHTRTLGIFSHVRTDLKAAAAEAGCDEVVPRSAFAARLPQILQDSASSPGLHPAPHPSTGGTG
jgi:CheY-like chemotaxis protein